MLFKNVGLSFVLEPYSNANPSGGPFLIFGERTGKVGLELLFWPIDVEK